jgi:dephospho-CoA kinase
LDKEKTIGDNPYIPKPADYFSKYNESIEENFGTQQKESLALQKLTFELFNNDDGKKWLDEIKSGLAKQMCIINICANNGALLLAEQRGKMLLIEEILMTIQAHKDFLKSN